MNPIGISPATRRWAISALVLGVLSFLSEMQGVFGYQRAFAMYGSKAIMSYALVLMDEVLAVVFIVGASLLLSGRQVGRRVLTYASATAVGLIILSSVCSWILFHDSNFILAMTKAMSAASQQLPANFVSIFITSMSIGVVAFGAIKAVYCFFLYRHMSTEPTEPSMAYVPTPYDGGTWPPPPTQ